MASDRSGFDIRSNNAIYYTFLNLFLILEHILKLSKVEIDDDVDEFMRNDGDYDR